MDYLAGIARLRPWRCRDCDARFFAWAVPISYVWLVHCKTCGNMDVQRISAQHGDGSVVWLCRLLGLPAYRCSPCRNRFFSMRKFRPAPIVPDAQAEGGAKPSEADAIVEHSGK